MCSIYSMKFTLLNVIIHFITFESSSSCWAIFDIRLDGKYSTIFIVLSNPHYEIENWNFAEILFGFPLANLCCKLEEPERNLSNRKVWYKTVNKIKLLKVTPVFRWELPTIKNNKKIVNLLEISVKFSNFSNFCMFYGKLWKLCESSENLHKIMKVLEKGENYALVAI